MATRIAALALPVDSAARHRVDAAAIANRRDRGARAERTFRRGEADEILAAGDHLDRDPARRLLDLGGFDRESARIQPEDRRRAVEAQFDADLAAEAGFARVDRDVRLVGGGSRRIAQAELGRPRRIRGACEAGCERSREGGARKHRCIEERHGEAAGAGDCLRIV